MTTLTYREAIIQGMSDALEADDDVFFLGEDVAAAGGAFKLSEGLLERFGPRRVLDTPISEQAIIGTAIGAAAPFVLVSNMSSVLRSRPQGH